MNLRLVIPTCYVAALGLFQAGCASTPTTTDTDMRPAVSGLANMPQMVFPGATRPEVKALAMGAAKSRAWNIVESKDDRIVVQRPLDASSQAAQRLAASGIAPGGLVEVTSHFVEQRGGVKVALDAAVVSRAPGSVTASRTDATEIFRPSLTESLESLHASWTKNRARVAGAAPPTGSARTDVAADFDGGTGIDSGAGASTDPAPSQPTAWSDETVASVTEPSPTQTETTDDWAPTSPASSTPQPTASTPIVQRPIVQGSLGQDPSAPEPIVLATQYPQRASPTGVSAYPVTRTPEPRRSAGGPAPVVDASPGRASVPSSGAISQPMTLPEPVSELSPVIAPLPARNTVTALSPSAATVSWSYYAEQYARLRGCQVTPQGAILIDTRSDGEIHKVPCEGADSLLVQCQNGECRGLL